MITEKAAARTPSTRRPRRLGDGMLTPVEVLEFRNPQTGRVELLRPGRDCVSPQWFGYRRHPELFRVANRGDHVTAARHRENLERARRLIERDIKREMAGTTRATTSSRQKRFQLPERRPERFRLP
jgi:hypothetical protein